MQLVLRGVICARRTQIRECQKRAVSHGLRPVKIKRCRQMRHIQRHFQRFGEAHFLLIRQPEGRRHALRRSAVWQQAHQPQKRVIA